MINIVVALDCEARPLIDHYQLQRQQSQAYPVYSAEHLQLIVSGVGNVNAAAATGYLAGLSDNQAAWLNVGIAGHQTHALGTAFLIHKISQLQEKHSWYPAFSFKTNLPTASLITSDAPVNDYSDNDLHDMESAGFYQAARHFNTVEFIHCLKIISDNRNNETHKINKQMVLDLMRSRIDSIATFIDALELQMNAWQDITAIPDIYTEILKRHHFSTYQQHQLKQIVQRWQALHPEQPLSIEQLMTFKNSRDLLKHIQASLDIRPGH